MTFKNSMIPNSHTKLFAGVFSRKVLSELASEGFSKTISEVVCRTHTQELFETKTLSDLFDYYYEQLVNSYRNEYVYKNAIATKLVLGRHKLANVAFFTEFKAWDTVADVVVVNGTTTAYEIKTEYDSFARLDNQLEVYQSVFDKVFLVVPESMLQAAYNNTPEHIGILVLNKRFALSCARDAQSNLRRVSPQIIFSCLRKYEYEYVIVKYFGSLPSVEAIYLRRKCAELFSTLAPEIIQEEFLRSLKARQDIRQNKNYIEQLPKSIASLVLSAELTENELSNLSNKLNDFL